MGLPSLRYCACVCDVAVVRWAIEELVRKLKGDPARGTIPAGTEYRERKLTLNVHYQSPFYFWFSSKTTCGGNLGDPIWPSYSCFRKTFWGSGRFQVWSGKPLLGYYLRVLSQPGIPPDFGIIKTGLKDLWISFKARPDSRVETGLNQTQCLQLWRRLMGINLSTGFCFSAGVSSELKFL